MNVKKKNSLLIDLTISILYTEIYNKIMPSGKSEAKIMTLICETFCNKISVFP